MLRDAHSFLQSEDFLDERFTVDDAVGQRGRGKQTLNRVQQTAHLAHVAFVRRSAREITGPECVRVISVREKVVVFDRERSV